MNLPRVSSALAVHTIRIFSKGDMTMGRTKLGNRNAQQNNNAKRKTASDRNLILMPAVKLKS